MVNTRILLVVNAFLVAALLWVGFAAFKGNGSGGGFNVPEQTVRSISLDKDFNFCGEKFPMDNWDVRQRLDAELLRNVYFHSQTILAIKRANSLFPVIEPILKEEGMPDDLKYLAVAESALSNTVSPAGARGVWQFMKDAAGEYGLEVNTEIDERYHLEKATHAACKYLKNEPGRLAPGSARLNERNTGITQKVVEIATLLNCSPAHIALSWVRAQSPHIIPIIAGRKVSQIKDNLESLSLTLPEEHLLALNEVSKIEMGFPHDFLQQEGVRNILFNGRFGDLIV